MTKKDFILIARVIRELVDTIDLPEETRNLVAYEFARALKTTNGRFRPDTFLSACGAE